MEPQIIGQDSLVLPTGATTGERIEINVNDSGLINIYNASNKLVASLGGADGSIYVTDGSTVFAKMVDGEIQLGGFSGGSPDFTDAGVLTAEPAFAVGDLRLISGKNPPSSLNDPMQLDMFPGATGLAPPQATFSSKSGTNQIYVQVNGVVISATPAGVADTWLTIGAAGAPAYGANWAGNSAFNGLTGFGHLKIRRLPNDTAVMNGCFVSGTTTPANPVFVIPAALRPMGDGAAVVHVMSFTGGATGINLGMGYVSTSGNFDLFSGLSVPIAASTQYLAHGVWPIQSVL